MSLSVLTIVLDHIDLIHPVTMFRGGLQPGETFNISDKVLERPHWPLSYCYLQPCGSFIQRYRNLDLHLATL